MENLPNVNQILIDEIRDLKKDIKLLLSLHGKVSLPDKFDIKGQAKAAKELNISVKKLQYNLKEGKILKINKDYRMSASGEYSFSKRI